MSYTPEQAARKIEGILSKLEAARANATEDSSEEALEEWLEINEELHGVMKQLDNFASRHQLIQQNIPKPEFKVNKQ